MNADRKFLNLESRRIQQEDSNTLETQRKGGSGGQNTYRGFAQMNADKKNPEPDKSEALRLFLSLDHSNLFFFTFPSSVSSVPLRFKGFRP